MELSERLGALEEDINLIKVEIKTVLVDLREELLKRQGPLPYVEDDGPVIDFVTASHRAGHVRTVPVEAHPAPAPVAPEPEWQPAPEARPVYTAVAPQPPVSRPTQPEPAPIDYTGQPAAPLESPPTASATTVNWGVVQIASLGKWAENASKRVGRTRLEELLSVYGLLTGREDVAIKEALLRMVDLCGPRTEPTDVSMNDILVVLSQLDALFRSHNLTEVTVLSMLSEVA
jgi:hypothetical protein